MTHANRDEKKGHDRLKSNKEANKASKIGPSNNQTVTDEVDFIRPPSPNINPPTQYDAQVNTYRYTAVTNNALAQHQRSYATTTTTTTTPDHNDMRPLQRFQSDPAFPYQRYNSYEPLSYSSMTAQQAVPGYGHTTSLQPNSLSYASVPSYTVTPSYNSTSSVAYPAALSIQAEPEREQYTHSQDIDQHTAGYWINQSNRFPSDEAQNDLVGVGSQFGYMADVVDGGDL